MQITPQEDLSSLKDYYEGVSRTVLSVKVTPVLYFAKPVASDDPAAVKIWTKLGKSKRTRRDIKKLLRLHKNNKELLRKVFLKQGYLFEDRPGMAMALVSYLSLKNLFDEDTIYRYRAGQVQTLKKTPKGYFNEQGIKAQIILNDRVATNRDDLLPPMHLELEEIRKRTGAQRTLPLVVGSNSAGFELVYPDGEHRQAMVELRENATEVVCIDGDLNALPELTAQAKRFWQHHNEILTAAHALVKERPQFDEPEDEPEDVQEDGELRVAWYKAYRKRQLKFKFREVEYPVFDRRGNPIPPQVCVDFIVDVWERASGTWYRKRGERPGRTNGSINFRDLEGLNRRSISSIMTFANQEDVPIHRFSVPHRKRVPLKQTKRFARAIASFTDFIREGDALIIHGIREQDMEEHYHSVLVLKTEPMTGMPMVVADNQGRPRIGSLITAMRAAPLRSVKWRIRVDFQQMEAYLDSLTLEAQQATESR